MAVDEDAQLQEALLQSEAANRVFALVLSPIGWRKAEKGCLNTWVTFVTFLAWFAWFACVPALLTATTNPSSGSDLQHSCGTTKKLSSLSGDFVKRSFFHRH